MFRKAFMAIVLSMACFCGIYAIEPEIREIQVALRMMPDGSASVLERWDATVTTGTEYFLPRYNLGDIEISDFKVVENGVGDYSTLDYWDIHRSIEQKARTCGINRVSQGVELCWGIGNYGDHVWNLSYTMKNAVKSLNDYDMLHLQLVNPGLSSRPQYVRVEIDVEGKQIDTTNARMWGFGYIGSTAFKDGAVIFESTEPFSRESSVIALIRLDKGVIDNPSSVQDKYFDEVLDRAMEGADFGDDEIEDPAAAKRRKGIFGGIAAAIVGLIGFGAVKKKRNVRKKFLGTTNLDEILWNRDIPYGGGVMGSRYVLEKLGMKCSYGQVAAAMIIKMTNEGALSVRNDAEGKLEVLFTDSDKAQSLGPSYNKLWRMLYDASGSDEILQNKEFSKWSKKNGETVNNWIDNVNARGEGELYPYKDRNGITAAGQVEGRKLIGLKKFLEDYTLIKERGAGESILWKDYLVFAALFGIADKVAKELKDINPELFKDTVTYNTVNAYDLMRFSDLIGRQIVSSKSRYDAAKVASIAGNIAASSVSGLGGRSSFGGGGGFSGGGFGGGSR